MTRHIPVLLEEVRASLSLQKGMMVVDATLGGGGHASMLLAAVAPTGRVIAFDTDREALERFRRRATADTFLQHALDEGRLILVQSNYSDLASVLDRLGVAQVDGILADLGFSSDQIEEADRGFSFQENGPLDMRLSRETTLTAEDIVMQYPFEELTRILREYGDEPEAKRITEAIIARRAIAPIATTHDLAALIALAYPKRKQSGMKIHPATRAFQALRIAVNQEFEHLEAFLKQATERLRPGGRLAVITFHSGEDSRVKWFMRGEAQGCICPPTFPVCRCGQVPRAKILTRKPIIAGEEEEAENPRSRSAKLRVLQKL